MKAAVWHGRRDIRIEQFPDPPPPGGDEMRIRVDWCGICGTDLEEYVNGPLYIPVDRPDELTGRKAPLVIGHELVGTVVELGPNVTEFELGDRVAPDTLLFCGECWYCTRHLVHQCRKLAILGLMTDGGCAEYVNAPARMCYRLPAAIPSETGALAEPAAVAVRAVRTGGVKLGDTVVIVGGGNIGLLCLQVALLSGAAKVYVIEPHESRRRIARSLRAEQTIDPTAVDSEEALMDLTRGAGADVVLECGGNPATMRLAPLLARPQGTVVMIGLHNEPIGVNLFPVVCREITIKGSFSHIYDVDFAEAVLLLGTGKLIAEPLITARIGVDDAVEKGFERLLHNKGEHLKILISPQNQS
ncbi:MAG: 2,3-butanediol dehydrogenase [Acidobacteriia bacterium]|nr:2,3-butanediol dehydrogenase [Terriglobia bacterium]